MLPAAGVLMIDPEAYYAGSYWPAAFASLLVFAQPSKYSTADLSEIHMLIGVIVLWSLIVWDANSWFSAILSLSLSVMGMMAGKMVGVLILLLPEEKHGVISAILLVVGAVLVLGLGVVRMRREWAAARRSRTGVMWSEFRDDEGS